MKSASTSATVVTRDPIRAHDHPNTRVFLNLLDLLSPKIRLSSIRDAPPSQGTGGRKLSPVSATRKRFAGAGHRRPKYLFQRKDSHAGTGNRRPESHRQNQLPAAQNASPGPATGGLKLLARTSLRKPESLATTGHRRPKSHRQDQVPAGEQNSSPGPFSGIPKRLARTGHRRHKTTHFIRASR